MLERSQDPCGLQSTRGRGIRGVAAGTGRQRPWIYPRHPLCASPRPGATQAERTVCPNPLPRAAQSACASDGAARAFLTVQPAFDPLVQYRSALQAPHAKRETACCIAHNSAVQQAQMFRAQPRDLTQRRCCFCNAANTSAEHRSVTAAPWSGCPVPPLLRCCRCSSARPVAAAPLLCHCSALVQSYLSNARRNCATARSSTACTCKGCHCKGSECLLAVGGGGGAALLRHRPLLDRLCALSVGDTTAFTPFQAYCVRSNNTSQRHTHLGLRL